jgi:hypothetical protein
MRVVVCKQTCCTDDNTSEPLAPLVAMSPGNVSRFLKTKAEPQYSNISPCYDWSLRKPCSIIPGIPLNILQPNAGLILPGNYKEYNPGNFHSLIWIYCCYRFKDKNCLALPGT